MDQSVQEQGVGVWGGTWVWKGPRGRNNTCERRSAALGKGGAAVCGTALGMGLGMGEAALEGDLSIG